MERDTFGGHTWACPGSPTVDILIIIREGTEVIRPLACGSESTVATCVAVINYYTSIAFCILVPTAYFR